MNLKEPRGSFAHPTEGKVVDPNEAVSATILTHQHTRILQEGYAVRRITPREALRLMDVDEAKIDTLLASGLSDTQLFKMAGNSIVVSCLYHIFDKMFGENAHILKPKEPTLF